jgi:hypothetical protein
MRVGSAAEMPAVVGTMRASYSKTLVSATCANCIRGNGILRPETLDETGGLLRRETVQSPSETQPHPANSRNCRAFPNPGASCQSGATGWWRTQSRKTGLHVENSLLAGNMQGTWRIAVRSDVSEHR